VWEIVELFPAIARSAAGAQGSARRRQRVAKGVKEMKIAASESVVPMLSVHKFG